jgi:hypothetical protein
VEKQLKWAAGLEKKGGVEHNWRHAAKASRVMTLDAVHKHNQSVTTKCCVF